MFHLYPAYLDAAVAPPRQNKRGEEQACDGASNEQPLHAESPLDEDRLTSTLAIVRWSYWLNCTVRGWAIQKEEVFGDGAFLWRVMSQRNRNPFPTDAEALMRMRLRTIITLFNMDQF
jgi:hypothetical protein